MANYLKIMNKRMVLLNPVSIQYTISCSILKEVNKSRRDGCDHNNLNWSVIVNFRVLIHLSKMMDDQQTISRILIFTLEIRDAEI